VDLNSKTIAGNPGKRVLDLQHCASGRHIGGKSGASQRRRQGGSYLGAGVVGRTRAIKERSGW
jgi:hypothetical protein